jgi:hypothetical protein
MVWAGITHCGRTDLKIVKKQVAYACHVASGMVLLEGVAIPMASNEWLDNSRQNFVMVTHCIQITVDDF